MQGRTELHKQDLLITTALQGKFKVCLGGAHNHQRKWGEAMAVYVGRDASLSKLRSELGNRLVQCSVESGLRPVGVVAYIEV